MFGTLKLLLFHPKTLHLELILPSTIASEKIVKTDMSHLFESCRSPVMNEIKAKKFSNTKSNLISDEFIRKHRISNEEEKDLNVDFGKIVRCVCYV